MYLWFQNPFIFFIYLFIFVNNSFCGGVFGRPDVRHQWLDHVGVLGAGHRGQGGRLEASAGTARLGTGSERNFVCVCVFMLWLNATCGLSMCGQHMAMTVVCGGSRVFDCACVYRQCQRVCVNC